MKKSFEFLYRIEEDIVAAEKETGEKFPDCLTYVDCKTFLSTKETLEEAIADFLAQDLGTLWDVDEEVKTETGDFIHVEWQQDYDGRFYVNKD